MTHTSTTSWILPPKDADTPVSMQLKTLFLILKQQHIEPENIVKFRAKLHNLKELFPVYNTAYSECFQTKHYPARVTLGSPLNDGALVMIQCITADGKQQIIQTEKAPAAIGPYAQAVQVGKTVFISGQIPIDPTTKALAGNDIHTQSKQVIRNINAILEAADMEKAHVFEVIVYTTNQENEEIALRECKGEFFNARRTSEIVQELPAGSLVEIEATAQL